VAPACLDLEFSTAQESIDKDDDAEVQVEIDSPAPAPAQREGHDVVKESEKAAARISVSPDSGAKGMDVEGDRNSLDSSSYFVRVADPEAFATELGAKPTAVHLGGNVVKSLRFESRDRERELLAEAAESFCFPLMEKELMEIGLENILESA
jgi:hypothetical protein